MNNNIEMKLISGKEVYVFESHKYAIYPWAKARQESTAPLDLITLDYHTDTRDPFYMASIVDFVSQRRDMSIVANYLNTIDYNNISSIDYVIDNLKYDEHITTAIEKDIINNTFVITHSCMSDGYYRNVYHTYFGEYSKDDVLEDFFLVSKLAYFMDKGLEIFIENGHVKFKNDYILDIDLDYFNTARSIEPICKEIISDLIKNAKIITIAKESSCVKKCKLKGEIINSDFLLEKILKLIEESL